MLLVRRESISQMLVRSQPSKEQETSPSAPRLSLFNNNAKSTPYHFNNKLPLLLYSWRWSSTYMNPNPLIALDVSLLTLGHSTIKDETTEEKDSASKYNTRQDNTVFAERAWKTYDAWLPSDTNTWCAAGCRSTSTWSAYIAVTNTYNRWCSPRWRIYLRSLITKFLFCIVPVPNHSRGERSRVTTRQSRAIQHIQYMDWLDSFNWSEFK